MNKKQHCRKVFGWLLLLVTLIGGSCLFRPAELSAKEGKSGKPIEQSKLPTLDARSAIQPFAITLPTTPRYTGYDDAFDMKYQLLKHDGTPAVGVPYEYEVVKYLPTTVPFPGIDNLLGVQVIGDIGSTKSGISDNEGIITLSQVNGNDGQGMMVRALRIENLGIYTEINVDPEPGSGFPTQKEYIGENYFTPTSTPTFGRLNKYVKWDYLETISGGRSYIGYDYDGNYIKSSWSSLPSTDNQNYINKEWAAQAYSIRNYYTADNSPIKLFYQRPYIEEVFVDPKGTPITPPTDFEQNKRTLYESIPFTHTMERVPTSYEINGETYVYRGYRAGSIFNAATPLKYGNPPTHSIDAYASATIFLVYEKGTPITVTESYYTDEGAKLTGVSDQINEVISGSGFASTPQAKIADTQGKSWVYQGWLTENQTPGVDTPNTSPVSLPAVTASQTLKYVYTAERAVGTITVRPDNAFAAVGETIRWIGTLTNTSDVPMEGIVLGKESFSGLTYMNESTKIDNVAVPDTVWTVPLSQTLAPGASLEITFNTKTLGDVGDDCYLELSAEGNFDSIKAKNVVELRNTSGAFTLQPVTTPIESGDVVIWRGTLKNTGSVEMNTIQLSRTLQGVVEPELFSYEANSTKINNISQADQVWFPDNPLTNRLAPGEELTIEFQTRLKGVPDKDYQVAIQVSGNFTSLTTQATAQIKKGKGSVVLIPSKKLVVTGDVIKWTAVVTNSNTITLRDIRLAMQLTSGSSTLTYKPGSTTINYVSVNDDLWTTEELEQPINPSQEMYITFETIVNGIGNTVVEAGITLTGNFDSMTASDFVRIEDADHFDFSKTEDIGLKNLPKRFDFGRANISAAAQKKDLSAAAYTTDTLSNGLYIRIFDDRVDGSTTGWRMNLSLEQFKNAAGTEQLPTATTIEVSGVTLKEVVDRDTDDETLVPVTGTNSPSLTSGSTLRLPSDGSSIELMQAGNEKGKGMWQVILPAEQIKLDIPANVGKINTEYQSVLNWTLIDAF